MILIFFLVGIIVFLAYFYRDPERKIPKGKNLVSPADGKIIEISKNKLWKIVIFMNLYNVHVQRFPSSGEVIGIKNISGKNLPAYKKDSSHNKCVQTTLKTKIGNIVVKQLTGLLVRRISVFAKKGDIVNKGQRLGRIAFGSRVELYLPDKVKIKVKKGQTVFAGETIVAEMK